ncbi:hypothetical protein [Aestuariispira ectoiniformans]|uniref:hypothetical protein n=1 Tax=Aestuariispira ectoiniformans TaxID=2775080 RepID=UPI00223C36AE|nr:hypothetical protein [Aestuariispira ectoiniformans]
MSNTGKKLIRRSAVFATLLAITPMLGGCLQAPFAAAAGATVAFVHEDKLPTDYIAEAVTGEDCSYVRRLEDGGPLCRSYDYGQVIEKPIYCYRSLGNVTCYDRPNPYGDGAQPVQ